MIGTDALSEDLLAEVRRRYGLNGRVAARRLTGGFANDVFRLDGDGAPTVLHVKLRLPTPTTSTGSTVCLRW